MEIAVFGAGVAGLMTAITLCAHGHRCRIYERSHLSHAAGMGFILMAEAVDTIESYGVYLEGVPLKSYLYRDAAGAVLVEQPMPAGAYSIRRSSLMSALMRALPPNAVLTFGAELNRLEFDQAGRVSFACLDSKAGPMRIQAELYVGADGIHSRARRGLFPQRPVPTAQVMELVGRVCCPRAIAWAGRNFNKFHAPGGGLAVGIIPVDAEHVVWYLQFDAHNFPPPREDAGPTALRAFAMRLAGDWGDPIPSLLEQTDFSGVHLWRPVDPDLVPHFHRHNLVLAGDAAHPLSPFTSQGVSSALADADLLARKLAAERVPEEALVLYSAERHSQCAPFIAQGRELMRQFLAPRNTSSLVMPIAK
ncbi:MAG TPA: NAD(P)/FAD-dependent oxidoreductase [Candidatus Saccharimonadales bacterium]|jgi:salicylate hydroxylase|nr:NAD(P)/FAD-dependent oxidoreductase [Candidatus Saccharimonadales bacterium]